MNTRNSGEVLQLVTGLANWKPYCESEMVVLCGKTYYGMEQERTRGMKHQDDSRHNNDECTNCLPLVHLI